MINNLTLQLQTSYSAVRLMFQPALGISESSTLEEREEKILSKLGDVKGTYFLASLNPIFNVKFGFSSNYQLLDGEEKLLAKELMRKKLHRMVGYNDWGCCWRNAKVANSVRSAFPFTPIG